MTRPIRSHLRDFVRPAVAWATGIALLAVFLWLTGLPVAPALGALWDGAFGSWYAFTSAVLVRATPLIILGLGFSLGARSGALNIGMEGQFAAGAMAATWVGVHLHGVSPVLAIPVTLLAGICGGTLWIVLPVVMRSHFGITEVISTLLLTFVATAAVSFAVTGPLQEPTRVYPESALIAPSARLPHLVTGSRLHAGFFLAVALALIGSVLLHRTRWGFMLRATGANARAAAISGRLATERIAAIALLGSGALAGLGGGIEVAGVSYALYQNLSPGYGFTAIAVALLGQLEPAGVLLSGIAFGALDAGSAAMQRSAGVPAVAAQVVEGVVIIAMIVGQRRARR